VHLSPLSPILLAAVLAAGCASQQAGYDYDDAVDFGKLRRWAWLPEPREKPSADARLDSPLLRKRIEAAVSRTLEARGFEQTQAQAADFEVGYIVTVEKKISSSGISSSIGFGRYSGGSGFGISFGGPATQPREYEEGTLIIDIKARDSGKLVWRGSSTRGLGQAASPEESEKVVNSVVEEILANFPPKADG